MSFDKEGASPVTLSTHARPRGQAVLAQVEAYWRSLRGDRLLPLRSDVDPSRIAAALPHAFMLERVAPGVARLRVAGQALNAVLGTEARGMPLSAFMAPASRGALRDYIDRAFDEPAVLDLPVAASRGAFRARAGGRLLVLPLLGSDGEASRALGALLLDAPAGREARQFEIPEDGSHRCERVEPPHRDAARAVAASPDSGPVAAARGAAGRPWLRLVVSNP